MAATVRSLANIAAIRLGVPLTDITPYQKGTNRYESTHTGVTTCQVWARVNAYAASVASRRPCFGHSSMLLELAELIHVTIFETSSWQ